MAQALHIMKYLMNIIFDTLAYYMSLEGEYDHRLDLYDVWIMYKDTNNLFYALL